MNPIPQFTPHLKQLRLSGILDFLEVRNPQAVEQKLAYTDFLALLIVGPCGTSKSHLAQALGHIAVRRGYDIVFTSHAKLLGQLSSARAVGNYERKLAALTKAGLLIIDDFGLKPMRPGQDEDFHDVIADRYERRPTIITSNLDFLEWNDAFRNMLLGAAILDRISTSSWANFCPSRAVLVLPLRGALVLSSGQDSGQFGREK
jgi:DNA replication protein DnaC